VEVPHDLSFDAACGPSWSLQKFRDALFMTDRAATPAPKLPLMVCIGWGAGTLAVASLFNAVNVLLLRYLVDFVGLGAGLAGSMIALSKFYDALIDPTIGTLSDRSRSPAGRRRPFVLAGGLLLVIASLMLFNTPDFSRTGTLVWVVASLLVYATAYATFSVPYMAMPAEMTRDYHERSYLISFRVLAVALASLLAVFVGPVVIGSLGGGRQGHTALSILISVVVFAGTLFCYFATARAPAHYAEDNERIGFLRKLVLITENKPFMLLLAIKLMQLLALAVSQAAMPFLFKRVLALSDTMLGLYFLVFYGIMIAVQPIWVRLGRRHGKRRIYLWATVVYALIYASWYLVSPDEARGWIYVRGAMLGVTGGAVLLFGQSLLPDTMEWDYRRTGLRREGMLAGLYTVVEKLAYALGSGITGIVLGASGYIQGAGKAVVVQPPSAISAIFLLASFLPMTLLLLSCIGLRFYSLSEASLHDQAPPREG
jgi:GPH family glycoside/pentoside/hexuronide:cation symporter